MERGKDGISVRKLRGGEKRKKEEKEKVKGEIRRGREGKKRKADSVWC